MKLRWYYLLVILAVGLLPLLLSAWFALRTGQQTLRAESEDNLRLLNRLISDELNQYVANVAERLRGRSTYPDFARYAADPSSGAVERVLEVLDRVHNIDPVNISSVALLNARGEKLLDTDASQSLVNEADSPWIVSTVRRERGAVFPELKPGERPFLWVTAPVRADSGAFVGIVRIRLQLAVLQQIVQRATSGLSTHAMVVDEKGLILAHGLHPELIGQPSERSWTEPLETPTVLPDLVPTRDQGESMRVSAVRLIEVPWIAAVFQSESAHESGPRQLAKVTLILIGVAVVFSAVAGLLAAEWLSRPIRGMAEVARRVGRGEIDALVRVSGPEEVQALGRAFNAMTARLKESLEELERRVIETELSERRTREIVAANPIAVAVADERGELTQLNQAFVSLYGYTLAEIQNMHDFWIRAFPDASVRSEVVRAFDERIELSRRLEANVDGFETSIVTQDGLTKTIELRARALGPMIIVASLDLTARRAAELEVLRLNLELEERVAARTLALSNANAELESFSYAVSHDLRSPLRAIDGFSRALEEDYGDQLNAEGRDYLARIKTATKRMGMLIDDLLKLSRVTRAELKKEPLDLSERARDIVDELRAHEPDRKVTFICAPHALAEGDRNLVRIALENLLHNAWKYSRKKTEAVIEFGTTERVDADGRLERVYYVKDNGAGFDMRYAGKLFGAFQRLHSPAEFEGTGIGLATVRRVVNRHGGRIWAEAELERGATLSFTLSEPRNPTRTHALVGTHSPFPIASIPHVPRQDIAG